MSYRTYSLWDRLAGIPQLEFRYECEDRAVRLAALVRVEERRERDRQIAARVEREFAAESVAS